MRDPDGTIEFHSDTVVRQVTPGATAKQFLRSPHATKLIDAGQLVGYDWQGENTLVSPKLPFVSYPFEWCDAQLHQAAKLTLDISRDVLDAGYELKDASAWNVIYHGNKPMFCDLLSFQPIASNNWWPFGQFVRHFLLPLAVSLKSGLKPYQCFSVYRDGIPPEVARNIIGLKRYFTRYWPLMVTGDGKAGGGGAQAADDKSGKRLHGNLYEFCETMLNGSQPNQAASHWADYTATRSHYTDEASAIKYQKVGEWVDRVKPGWVIDLGCNTGEFSMLAAKSGAQVISVDLDHDSIQKLVLAHPNATNINPLVTNLCDMVGGRGWCGDEFPSLMTRLHERADLLLLLAVIHHLSIAEGVHLAKVAKMAAHITKKYTIVEMLGEDDPMVVHLCKQRQRNPKDFALETQMVEFSKYFSIETSFSIPNTSRKLCLLKKL